MSLAAASAMELRNLDASRFNAWFTAVVAGDADLEAVAERRFRSEYRVAFGAWRATNPETNPDAPPGPSSMPQYRQPELARARALDEKADEAFAVGVEAGKTSDDYVRTTVFLASVLFLVGLSTHFPIRGVRYGLIGLGAILFVVSVVQLSQLPSPPA